MLTQTLRSGPEIPTLIERFVQAVPLPYASSCLLLAILTGPPVQFLSVFLDTRSLEKAFTFTVNTAYGTFQSTTVSTYQGLAEQTIWTATIFVALYMPHFMRSRILASEPTLITISPAGEETIHKSFGGVSRLLPQLALSILFSTLVIPYVINQSPLTIGPVFSLYQIISNVIFTLMFGTFIWVYFRSLWGLYKFGKEPLRLRPYQEDPLLGAKPIGSISFTLFLAYNLFVGLSTLGILLTPDPVGFAFLMVLASLGGLMFILPLYSIHRRMTAVKQNERQKLFEHFVRLSDSSQQGSSENTDHLLMSIRDVQILQFRKEFAASIPTWPFDTSILGRFAAVVLSVIAILLSRIITLTLHL